MLPQSSTSERSTSPSSAFQFVNISSPSEIRQPGFRNLVRRSVAIHHRERQVRRHSDTPRQETVAHRCTGADSGSSSTPNFCQVCGDSLRKRRSSRSIVIEDLEEAPETGVETACLEAVVLGATTTDPFGTYPVPVQPYMHILLDHYVKEYCPDLAPFGKWDSKNNPVSLKNFQLAMKHKVYCHATLCIAAVHYGLLSGQNIFKALAYHHRGEAIKLLNRILQEGNGEVTELMIATVGALAHHDILVGDRAAVEKHRNGIVAMLRAHNENPESKLDSCHRFRVHWIDAIIANYSQSTPLLTVANPFNLVSQSRHVIPLATTSFASIRDSPHFSPTIIEVLQDLVSFTCDVRSWRGIRPPNEEVASFTSRRAWIEWKLSTLNQNHNSQQETAKTYGLENCVKLAMLIYINIVLRKMPSTSAELLYLTEEMKTALETADFKLFWGVHIKLFTWVLFHGGAAATEAGTRKWYVKQLVEVCRVLNIWSWESVSECLSGFLWVRCTLVHRIKPLWYETVVGLSIFEVADSL